MKDNFKKIIREIAGERIDILLGLASKESDPYSEYATHYVKLARRISEHYKIGINARFHLCRKCNAVLIPGKNAAVRIASANRYVVYKCSRCGSEVHSHY
ncbi:MAG: hypothetical protein QXR58_02080 [Candidatus Micrarchaeaceae archaeon]